MTNLVPRRASNLRDTQTLGFIISDYFRISRVHIFKGGDHHENFLSFFGRFYS